MAKFRSITKDEEQIYSTLYQVLSFNNLLLKLDNAKFLDSDYYDNLNIPNEYDFILKKSGLGNPALLQMMLYGLVVLPKSFDYIYSKTVVEEIDDYIFSLKPNILISTYKEDKNNIHYFRHIRNAISHGSTLYYMKNNSNYISFYDKDYNNHECKFELKTSDVGFLLDYLQNKIILIINSFVNNI